MKVMQSYGMEVMQSSENSKFSKNSERLENSENSELSENSNIHKIVNCQKILNIHYILIMGGHIIKCYGATLCKGRGLLQFHTTSHLPSQNPPIFPSIPSHLPLFPHILTLSPPSSLFLRYSPYFDIFLNYRLIIMFTRLKPNGV